jgi:ADP-ribose pyrophosphatase
MAATSNRSRIAPESSSAAKPITSPRAEVRARAIPAKSIPAKHPATPLVPRKSRSQKATLISSKLSFKGKVFNVYTDTLIEPSGHQNTRDVVRHNGSVVMLAVDERNNPTDPDVILERQYRHAAGQYLLELPAGSRNPNEPPLAAAKRELIEETGFRAKRWTLLLRYFASPGFLGEWMQIYLARDLREGIATPEQDEQIEIIRMPLSHAMKLIADGKIHDGKTLIGLSLYDTARRDGRL